MTYLEFLGEWYNLPWLAAIGAGLLLGLGRRLRARRASVAAGADEERRTSPAVVLVATGVVALTLNGAIHDFRLGPIGPRFPIVTLLAVAAGWLLGWAGAKLRRRLLPPVRGVTFNRPGLEGREAVVLSARVGPGEIGRGRHLDPAGISHVVRILVPEGAGEPSGAPVAFGRRVLLGKFDAGRRAYEVRPTA